MKYINTSSPTSKENRANSNQNILENIENLSPEFIFNNYTGKGGIHDLEFKDFNSFYEYTKSKKEIENGQFFTPGNLAEKITNLISINESDFICDPTCGAGIFFNYLPNESNIYGADIDADAIEIANKIYPLANIIKKDIREYNPKTKFDLIFGNPPFNIRLKENGKTKSSQTIYFQRLNDLLRTGAISFSIVPYTYLLDETFYSNTIKEINYNFNCLGSIELKKDTFKEIGVSNFKTKIIILQKKSIHIESHSKSFNDFITFEEAKTIIEPLKKEYDKLKYQILKESKSTSTFNDQVKKYLFELKHQKSIRKHLHHAKALLNEFNFQERPEGMTYEEWETKRLTETKVLTQLKKYVTSQHSPKEKDVIRLINQKSGYSLKAYSKKMAKIQRESQSTTEFPYYQVFNDSNAESKLMLHLNKGQKKAYLKKKQEHLQQVKLLEEEVSTPVFNEFIENFTFIGRGNKVSKFNDVQSNDIKTISNKNLALLNWQPGSGKTPSAYAITKYKQLHNNIKHVFILAPSIAIKTTWTSFMKQHKECFLLLDSIDDLPNIKNYTYILITVDFLKSSITGPTSWTKISSLLRKQIKPIKKKSMLLFDESDEITNYHSKKSKATREVFRSFKHKLLTTGTTTRNNINEIYGQLELFYNNSYNMLSMNQLIYKTNEDNELYEKTNPYYTKPFPAYGGQQHFKYSFNPSKSTVFGIQKEEQHLYNSEHLLDILKYTVQTRTFKEIAGEGKYNIITKQYIQNEEEQELYKNIMTEVQRLIREQYKDRQDDNGRKSSGLAIVLQLQLLIKSCSYPQAFGDYTSNEFSTKQKEIIKFVNANQEKIAIGTLTNNSMNFYYDYFFQDPFRKVFKINGDISFKKRQRIIKEFESTPNGILVSTQQSLSSSVNIPTCNICLLEALQWNIPKMEQYFRRFIRFDSQQPTDVYLMTYKDTIEQNMLGLLMNKEKLNEFIRCNKVKESTEIYDEFDIPEDIFESIISKEYDKDGKMNLNWKNQTIS